MKFQLSGIAPIRDFLQKKEQQLLKRRAQLIKEDPFSDPERLNDNAAVDTEAAEQFGHANVSAIRKEIDTALIRVKKALSRIKIGKYGVCEDCGKMIDTKRLTINPAASYCVECEAKRDGQTTD